MLYSEYGVVLYGNVAVAVTPKLLDQNADLCRAITEGLLAGLKFTLTRPSEAQELFLNAVPELKMTSTAHEFARLGMGVQRFSVLSGSADAKAHGLGWANHDKLDAMTDFVLRYQAEQGAKKPDLAMMFSNRLIGNIELSEAEWSAAEKETTWVAPEARQARMTSGVPSDPDAAFVRVNDVAKIYDTGKTTIEAIAKADFEVAKGQFVAVLGPSGCGKSTLLMMCAGLESITTGTIMIAGQPMRGRGPASESCSRTSVLLPWKSVLENVLFPIRILRRPRSEYIDRAHASSSL